MKKYKQFLYIDLGFVLFYMFLWIWSTRLIFEQKWIDYFFIMSILLFCTIFMCFACAWDYERIIKKIGGRGNGNRKRSNSRNMEI